MKAIVLAGGKGTRLAPYTTILPKPLLPIDDTPILDLIIRQLAKHGFDDVTLAVGHLAELVKAYCGDGSKYNLRLSYSQEPMPLGTAGPIAIVPDLKETFLVMNGDVLTTLNYSDMWRHHRNQDAIATLATCERDVMIELGVVESDSDQFVTGYVEKPLLRYLISAGICIFEPKVLNYISRGQALDLPDLILRLLKEGERVARYSFEGRWLHISRRDDYEAAAEAFRTHRREFLV